MTRPNRLLALILVVQIVIGVSYAVLTPLWQGHEQDYYTVTRFLVTQHRLPTEADYPNGDAEIRQATQPPLYFLLAAPVVALLDNGQPVPYGLQPTPLCPGGERADAPLITYVTNQAYNDPFQGTLAAAYALRIVNVLLGALAVVFTYKAGRVLFPEHPLFALIGAALLALEPATLQFVPLLSNDTLLLTVCAAILWMSARIIMDTAISWRDVAILIVLTIAAPLIKLPGWAALPLALLVIGYRMITHARGRRILLLVLGLIAVLTLAILAFNYEHYGSIFGRYAVLNASFAAFAQHLNIPWVVIGGVINDTRLEFLAPLNTLTPRAAFVTVYNLVLLVCVIGVVIGTAWALIRQRQRRAYGLLLALVVITAAIVLLRNALIANIENTTSYNLAMIFAPVRYYVPGLPPLALLVAAGLGAIVPRFSRGLLGVAPLAAFALISVAVSVMLIVTRPPNPSVDPAVLAGLPGIQQVNLQAAPDAPKIVAYQLQPEAGYLDLTLYTSLDQTTAINFMAQTQLGSDASRPPCEFLPTRGVYPTPRWSAGEVVQSEAEIPNCGVDLAADTPLILRWVGYSLDGKIAETTPAVTIATLDQPLKMAERCPTNLGVIAGRYQLIKWNSPPTVQAGALYLPSVNWLVFDNSPDPLQRVFRFVHGTSAYTCVGSPADTQSPVQSWTRGEYVYADACEMHFPVDAPAGTYQVYTGMQATDGQLLPSSSADTPWLLTGQVEVQAHG